MILKQFKSLLKKLLLHVVTRAALQLLSNKKVVTCMLHTVLD